MTNQQAHAFIRARLKSIWETDLSNPGTLVWPNVEATNVTPPYATVFLSGIDGHQATFGLVGSNKHRSRINLHIRIRTAPGKSEHDGVTYADAFVQGLRSGFNGIRCNRVTPPRADGTVAGAYQHHLIAELEYDDFG